MNRSFFFSLFMCLPLVGLADFKYDGKGLNLGDYIGQWRSSHFVLEDESVNISINKDLSTRLSRIFNGKINTFVSEPEDFSFVEDIVVFTYNAEDSSTKYRLVLSGWKLPHTKAIYGTLYMYYEGQPVNGLPISFRQAAENAH